MLIKSKTIIFVMLFCCVIISLLVVIPYKFNFVNSENFFTPEIVTPPDEEQPKDDPKQDEVKEEIPIYTNGMTCLFDAEKRLLDLEAYKVVNNVTVSAIGVEQKTLQIKIKSSDKYIGEMKSFSSSAFGKKDYQKVEMIEENTYKLTRGEITNAQYDINNSSLKEEIIDKEYLLKISPFFFSPIDILPQKDNGKISKFDRVTYENYYLVGFTFNVEKISADYANAIKNEGNLSSVTILSVNYDILISKKTGYIVQLQKNEIYTIEKGPIKGKTFAKHVLKFEY